MLDTSQGQSVSIFVGTSNYPGPYHLTLYNSAGEHIRTLDDSYLTASIRRSYSWDGKNKYGDPCASGIYIFQLTEPFGVKRKRIAVVR
jgi:flagellar hook assembly protein FlgD